MMLGCGVLFSTCTSGLGNFDLYLTISVAKNQNSVWKSLQLKAVYIIGAINEIKINFWLYLAMMLLIILFNHIWFPGVMSLFTNISLFFSDLEKSAAMGTQ